jgi:WS/DGAT/MGAT family acyltransferase
LVAIERLAEHELGAMEAMFLLGDAEVSTRSTVVVLVRFAEPPDYEAVVQAHERASRLVPHLRRRVVAPVLPVSRPYWVLDPDFDVRYHVRRVRLPGDGSEADLRAYLRAFGSVPVDPARPLWEVTLIEGLADGSGAMLFKLHHAIADGQGMAKIWAEVFELEPGGRAYSELPLLPAAEDVTGMELTRQKLSQLPFELGHGGVGGLRGGLSTARRVLEHPRQAVSSTASYLTSLRRTLTATPAQMSPLLARRGPRREQLMLSFPFADLQAAARALSTSLNSAYVAGVLGGLARYHEAHGSPVEELLLAVPVSVRRESDSAEVNRFVGVRIAGPACGSDAAERARLVNERIRAARDEPALEAVMALAPVVSRLPLWITEAAIGGGLASDVQVSNVPGWPQTAWLCGAEVTGFYGFGPLAGAALMVVMTTQGGRCDLGVNVDVDAVPDGDLLRECLVKSFDELLAGGVR